MGRPCPVVHGAHIPRARPSRTSGVLTTADFSSFHRAAAQLLAEHGDAIEVFPQGFPPPANVFDISSLPWRSFTGFTLAMEGGWDHLAPNFTLGRYLERDGKTFLPMVVQIHHAAADGLHTSRLLRDLEELMAEPSWIG